MKYRLLVVAKLLLCMVVVAQPQTEGKLVNGFVSKVSGTDFSYHSSVPVARECMLIRAIDGKSSMEWTTAPVAAKASGKPVTFVWLAGIGSSPGVASFDLAVNGIKKFTFMADGSEQWSLTAVDGSTLRFKRDMADQFGDSFGFMYLTVPAETVKPGEPITLKVTGGRHELTSWYMTFKFPVESGVRFKALPALTTEGGKNYQTAIAGVMHFGSQSTAKIYIGREMVKETAIQFGYNYVRVRIPAVKEKRKFDYRVEIEGVVWKGTIEAAPVRKWQVNFVQHTHTDIGYTRSQTEILAEHLRFIDYALDYCDNTDHYPDEAKFRWTCEASWAVDEYLKSRPQSQVERLLKRVAEGRIEITGMYFNFDELPDEQTLAASLQPLKRFRDLGIPVVTAMQNDVNGIGWCLNDFYADLGVKYLNMGTHGHRALIPFDKPTLFWWESPSGKRMLAYRAEHYMIGNTVFKIHAGDFNVFEDELLTYLTGLEAKGYQYDLVSIQHSGYLTDNAPPSTLACDMIRQWNEKYSWPKLKTASATEFFTAMEEKHGSSFEVIRGAWPDWWTDGFGASAREVAVTRVAQGDLIANTSGLTMAAVQGSRLPEKIGDRIEAVNSALLFYTEHTVGFHASVREPFHKYTMEQRSLKESYAWEAGRRAKMVGEETMGLLQEYITREKSPSLVVYNTMGHTRSGMVRVYIDHQILPRYSSFNISDKQGNKANAQPVERHSDGTYWTIWVDDIPAFGFKKYIITTDDGGSSPEPAVKVSKGTAQHGTAREGTTREGAVGKIHLENSWYLIEIDTLRGAISSITDKDTNLELVDANSEWKLGEFIYEVLDNRSQLESFKLDNYTREPLEKVWLDAVETGDVWNTIRFKGNTSAANRDGTYEFEIRLFNTAKRIDLVYYIEKKMVLEPEGIYIAFPFVLNEGVIAFDVQGGEIRAGIDQIPGSANDWNTVQNYARVSNGKNQIVISSPETPLMQFGGINTGRYKAGATPESTHIYGWPMNNYWVTNFNAEQHGGFNWVYSVTSGAGSEMNDAALFGRGNRTPFLARVLPGGGRGDQNWQASFIEGWPDNLLLISAIPEQDGRSAIIQLRETEGRDAVISLRNGLTGVPLNCIQVDVTGTRIEKGDNKMKPFETRFFRIDF